jgi:hypothetical protein
LSIASNIINIVVLIIQRYSFITTQFLGPFDDVITKFYCILFQLGPHILSALFSKTIIPWSSLNARDQVSHPYKTRDKIIVLYILICTFLESKREDRRF